MSNDKGIVFLASIPPIMTGIKTGGDGMRVQFDIPESEMNEASKLIMMRGSKLVVTVSLMDETYKPSKRVDSR